MSLAAHRLRGKLANWPAWLLTTYATLMAFSAYFSMYAFRRPFAALTYHDEPMLWLFTAKSGFVIAQVMGYATSKWIGIRFNSGLPHHQRAKALIWLTLAAQLALVGFALAPMPYKPIFMFLNGVPLGSFWGIVFSFLEGRKTSEILGAGLSCSYIVASGVVKSIGASLVDAGVATFWMPAVAGLLFLPILLLAIFGLHSLPPPTLDDESARTKRAPMNRQERMQFAKRYWPGVVALVLVYALLTALRDFRDNYARDLWEAIGYQNAPRWFTLSELPIALTVMIALSFLALVKNNSKGLAWTFAIMMTGCALVGVATLLFRFGVISGATWMILVGLGLYGAYVPYGCVLFDRLVAALGSVATAVFLIYVSDGFAYTVSVASVVAKELAKATSVVNFFLAACYIMSALTLLGFGFAFVYFRRATRDAR